MLKILSAILPFLGRRQSSSRFGGGPLSRLGGRRGGMAFGTLASIAAPFVIKKLMARRQQRSMSPSH